MSNFFRKYALMLFGILFLFGGSFILLDKFIVSKKVSNDTEQRIEDEIKDLKENPVVNDDYDDNVVKSVVDGKELTKTDSYQRLIGVIRNERINLKEPIYSGASEVNMRKGVATLNVEDELDQHLLSISGHRSPVPNQYFSEVPRLKNGDIIHIDTYDESGKIGETAYEVRTSYKLDPSDRTTLDEVPDEKMLRLVTCEVWNPKTKTYDKRLITEAIAL